MDNDYNKPQTQPTKVKSLKERSRIPNSFYCTVIGYVALAYFGNVFRVETLESWVNSMRLSMDKVYESLVYSQALAQTLVSGKKEEESVRPPVSEYLQVSFITLSVLSLLYIFVWAPFRAGFWTGTRSTKHVVHRYMGLAYMAQYFLAWFEFSTLYEESGKDSFLPMFIALNGKNTVLSMSFFFKKPFCIASATHNLLLTHCLLGNRCHPRMVCFLFLQSFTRVDRCWILFQ